MMSDGKIPRSMKKKLLRVPQTTGSYILAKRCLPKRSAHVSAELLENGMIEPHHRLQFVPELGLVRAAVVLFKELLCRGQVVGREKARHQRRGVGFPHAIIPREVFSGRHGLLRDSPAQRRTFLASSRRL